ncbi:hypothetical protein ABFU43_03940 [Xanthomonas campestris pv. raphani]|uniref:hypothetical protein n=1 Tax=Xanthomonas campestris TaxID=339 RepID=UPI00388D8DC7
MAGSMTTALTRITVCTLLALAGCERAPAPAPAPSPSAATPTTSATSAPATPAAAATPVEGASLALGCAEGDDPAQEASAIAARGGGMVQRVSAHRLQVTTPAGAQVFADTAPFDEPLEGEDYRFCDRRDGYLLLQHRDGGTFAGTLIDTRTGTQTPGGLRVVIAPDRNRYLATAQPDGMDGEEWQVLSIGGKQLASTTNALLSDDAAEPGIIATLDAPQWSTAQQLQATATCLSDETQQWQVRLVEQAGRWHWQPRRDCAGAPREQ